MDMKKQYIEFNIRHQNINRTDEFNVVGGSQNYLYARFTFCEDWAGEDAYAIFTGGGKSYRQPIVDGECEVPWEVLLTRRFFVGCEAGDRITSAASVVDVKPSGAPDANPGREPSPTIQSQIGNLADLSTEAKENLVAAINEALTKGGGEVDPEEIGRIVDEYLEQNPPAAYTLPIATETTLGGVKAAAATEEMTQPVGITEDGKLVTTPGRNSGGNVDQVSVEPAYEDIPKIFFGGALQQTKDEAVVPFRYISKTDDFSGYAEIKAQGNSSMSYPKKNQTVKMFKDAECTEKMKVDFKGWGKQNKHCYKANWIDLTHARNIVSARIWADIVKSRADYESLPELLRTSPNQGAVDGFPVKVYADGVYQGRYTVNIPKDKWMANMDDDLDTHCILCGEGYDSGCFRTASTAEWTDEIHDSMPSTISTRWVDVINFVMNSTDEEFKANLSNYFDVQSLIDYHLYGLASCGLDAYGKNQLYLTYDGQKWFASMYDMDATWGNYYNGSKILPDTYGRTEYEDFVGDRQGNLLFIRLEENFYEELQTRWAELKNGALSIENIINRFERFTDIAPAELVKEDYASTTGGGSFTGIPSQSTNNIQQIRSFALARQAWTDEYVAALTPAVEVPCTGISLSASELTFTAEGTQTLTATVTPDGCTDEITWESDNTSIATVDGGVVTAVANGSATITARCGDYSASCTVAISGMVDPVACTGITLDQTELTFDGEGTQTITATVEPADTTDPVVWVSSDPDVASIVVEDNVCTVQSVSNGDAVITATCGNQTAACNVTVSGIVSKIRTYTLTQTYDCTSDGDVTASGTTSNYGLLEYVEIGPAGTHYEITAKNPWVWVLVYDADKNFLRKIHGDKSTTSVLTAKEDEAYVRWGCFGTVEDGTSTIEETVPAQAEEVSNSTTMYSGYTYPEGSGKFTYNGNSGSCALPNYYPVTEGNTYTVTVGGIWLSIKGYDESLNYVSDLNTASGSYTNATFTVPTGVKYVRWSCAGGDGTSTIEETA